MRKKQKSAKIVKQISAILAVVFVFQVFTAFYTDNNKTQETKKVTDTYSFVSEPKNTITVAGVGNSDLYSGFVPLDFWKETGCTSAVYASARQSIAKSTELMQTSYATQKPKLVIIETDMFYDKNPANPTTVKESKRLKDLIQKIKIKHLSEDLNSVITGLGIPADDKNLTLQQTHGYRYSTKICKIKAVDYMAYTDNVEHMTAENTVAADKLINLAKKNGSQVLLVEMPSITSWNYERHNGVAEYAQSRGVKFLDLNLAYDDMSMDMTTCFRDKGNHLNYFGAKKATAYIAKYVAENYSLTETTDNTVKNQWNNTYTAFSAMKQQA